MKTVTEITGKFCQDWRGMACPHLTIYDGSAFCAKYFEPLPNDKVFWIRAFRCDKCLAKDKKGGRE